MTRCPILEVQIENPCITPSGHTVDGGVIDQWIGNFKYFIFIATGKKDQWDPSLTCNFKIPNLAVQQLIDFIEDYNR